MNITVLGAGAWGTAFGQVLADAGNHVTMWAIEPEIVEGIRDQPSARTTSSPAASTSATRGGSSPHESPDKIGRASCRERV